MGRYVSGLANTALFIVCCFTLANIVNSVFAAMLTRTPTDAAAPPEARPPAHASWSDRQVILSRNLFNASLLAPPAPAVEEEPPEELEATELPLDLIGTAASTDPEQSWAAVSERDTRKIRVVQVGDELKGKAKVVGIERKRIVLSEDGAHRELALAEGGGPGGAPRAAAPRKRHVARARSAARPRPAPARPPSRSEVEGVVRNPSRLFSQARILPKYEDGEFIGVEVSAIKPGSLFERAGLESGDVITELNGIEIDSPAKSAAVLQEFARATEFTVTVEGADGTETLTFTLPEDDE